MQLCMKVSERLQGFHATYTCGECLKLWIALDSSIGRIYDAGTCTAAADIEFWFPKQKQPQLNEIYAGLGQLLQESVETRKEVSIALRKGAKNNPRVSKMVGL